MIQRIQTIYFLLSAIITMLMFFFPVAELITVDDFIYTLSYRNISIVEGEIPKIVLETLPMAILFTINMLLSVTAIFLFNKRTVQMRITTFNILLAFGSLALMAFYIFFAVDDEIATRHFGLTSIIPTINIILLYLALKGIKHDEKLIKSMDRIR